ncbi:FAD-dependent oxidoreductase [Actinomadura rupiterrae]|uniref:FAD-dependent oxidoreductase n=1 Tax=Actinomadura rupiterrae TaxID=559627 RepID=UPI0020A2354A|nr:FAD-dependent oxidoreductase [Actinomadura rupiterrae]MCP2339974.1 3-oxosteroid 1-dehydrogenase [Actinomadura rupiterrae]
MDTRWDETFDVVVVGSGAAGLTAALTARLRGLSAVVLEKTAKWGGSTALSGGAIWVPGNLYLEHQGLGDSPEKARAYLDATVGDRVPAERKDAYLERGPEMVRFLHDRTRHVRFEYVRGYSDYYPERAGGFGQGRTVEPPVFDLRKLKGLRATMRRTELPTYGMVMKGAEFHDVNMIGRTLRGKLTALKIGGRFARAVVTGAKLASVGESLAARLATSLADEGGEIRVNTPFRDLVIEGDRVVGVIAERGGRTVRIRAEKGVVLASGGFSHSQELRERYLPSPTDAKWTSAAEQQTGDIVEAALKAGAELDLMDKVWGMPAVVPPGEKPVFLVTDRAVPGMVVVNQDGERYLNEALPYADFVDRMYSDGEGRAIPSWMVIDGRTKNRYIMLNHFPGQPFKKAWLKDGFIKKAGSVRELAGLMGVPAERLETTVARFNAMARNGRDVDFGRGDSAYDNFYGDPTLPNPNLAPLVKPPYYAIPLVPGDIGTKGGPVADADARVLRADGTVIEGLYAAGNASASVMGGTYPGAGATIGPAMTFGYAAATHMARP